MRFSPWSYRYADEILNSKLSLKKETEDAIRSIQVPPNGFSRPEMNKEIEKQLTARGWKGQPRVGGDREDLEIEAGLDFSKERVGVEVSLGHASFLGIDLLDGGKINVECWARSLNVPIGSCVNKAHSDVLMMYGIWKILAVVT
jgi:hypothetical protein